MFCAWCFGVLVPVPREKLRFSFTSYSVMCCGQPSRVFLHLLTFAIGASYHQQKKRLGCTAFHFELCFLCASPHQCSPLVLKAIFVSVSVPDHFLCLFWSMSNLSMIESPFRCLSLHHFVGAVSLPFLDLAVSATFLALHDLSFSCHVFLGCRAAAPHNRLGHTAFSSASILFQTRKQWAGQDSLRFRACPLLHSILCCTIGAELLPVSRIFPRKRTSLCTVPSQCLLVTKVSPVSESISNLS